MSTIKIPSDLFKSSQKGEKYGNLIRTKGISLDIPGILALAKKAIVMYSLSDDAGFGTPIAIETDGQFVYVLTSDGHTFTINLASDTFSITENSGTNQPTIGEWSDAVIFNNLFHASGTTNVKHLNGLGQGQNWHSSNDITGLDNTVPHPLCRFENRNTLVVGDGNILRQYSTLYVEDTTNQLVLPAEFIITNVRYESSTLTIGTRHKYGGEARMFTWNGAGASAQKGYGVGADWIYSQCKYRSSTAIITSAGQLRRFTGDGFEELAQLPSFYKKLPWTSSAANTSLIGKVANRGMRAVGDLIYINMDGSISLPVGTYPGPYLPEQPSGLWCFDYAAGLYHKAGYNYNSMRRLNPTELISNRLKFAVAHQAQTGDVVFCSNVVGFTGLNSAQEYYAIVGSEESAYTMRLALSAADALADREIAISGVNTNEIFFLDRYESMGQTRISSPGAILLFSRTFPRPYYGSEIMFGGAALDETLTAKGVLMSLGLGRNRSHFVLPKLYSTGVKDAFSKLFSFLEGLSLTTDQVVVKYRTQKRISMPTPLSFSGSASWTSATTFTVDSLLHDVQSLIEGDEIEIVSGAGGGYLAHITDITPPATGSTYTFTIDETMPFTSGSFDFIADNWKKVGDEIAGTDDPTNWGIAAAALTDDFTGKWVEYRVELRGRGVMIEEMQAVASSKIKAE